LSAEHEQGFAADFIEGDLEPVVPGTIQPFGFLVSVTADWLISHVSANTENHIGIPHRQMLGRPLKDFFRRETVHAIRNRMMLLREPDAVERLCSIALCEDRPPFDVMVHLSGPSIVIEAEPATGSEGEASSMARSMIARLRKADTMAAFLQEGARYVRVLTNFDRVSVHRFDRIGNGEVAAEASRAGVDSVLGLSYPASDIPPEARELYRRNALRIVADVNAEPVPIVPDATLDRSLCILRAVPPAEGEYMRSIGVAASLSVPIIIDGAMWGLFVCHHGRPRLPSFAQRSAAELFVQIFGLMLESRECAEAARSGAVALRDQAAARQH
jgi:light-regulated signal transduction histidine kinase (bacteriophytochrome)